MTRPTVESEQLISFECIVMCIGAMGKQKHKILLINNPLRGCCIEMNVNNLPKHVKIKSVFKVMNAILKKSIFGYQLTDCDFTKFEYLKSVDVQEDRLFKNLIIFYFRVWVYVECSQLFFDKFTNKNGR